MTPDRDELLTLFEALFDGPIAPAQHERLQERLASDAAARQFYFDYLDVRLLLRQWQRASLGDQTLPDIDELETVAACPSFIQTSPAGHAAFFAPHTQLGGFALSYVVATLIVGIGLLVGWVYEVSIPQSDRHESARNVTLPADAPSRPEPAAVFVGQITGMVDCQWPDPHAAPVGFDRIALGRKYVLASGLMEIAYDSGARVILQGPCTYQVESPSGGYLAVGRLTARVEKKGERSEERGEGRHSLRSTQQLASNNPSAFFAVRTPTATVTDLGTEFGVEVDTSGASKAHVYRGKVEVRVGDGNSAEGKVVCLGESESARVEVGKDHVVKVVRESRQPEKSVVRQMPKRVPIKLFNTGLNLKEGDRDPHWQLVARSDDAKFKAQPAVVVASNPPRYVANQASRSQWVAGGANPVLPDNVVCTFRTTFDLAGMRPSTAVLHGRFVVDNHVRAIRLNGRPIRVPTHGHQDFGFFHVFSSDRGFVDGANVLEIEVENVDPDDRGPASAMMLLVELDGSVLTAWSESSPAAVDTNHKTSKN